MAFTTSNGATTNNGNNQGSGSENSGTTNNGASTNQGGTSGNGSSTNDNLLSALIFFILLILFLTRLGSVFCSVLNLLSMIEIESIKPTFASHLQS